MFVVVWSHDWDSLVLFIKRNLMKRSCWDLWCKIVIFSHVRTWSNLWTHLVWKFNKICNSTWLDHWCKYESLAIWMVIIFIESSTSLKNLSKDSAWTQGGHGKFSALKIYRAHLSTREEKPCFGFGPTLALDVKVGEYHGVWIMVMINVSIYCGDQTPLWLPSSTKGDIVGNMM